MSQATAEKPTLIRPNVVITEEIRQKIHFIAIEYAAGKYDDMDMYTITLGRQARSLGLSYGQFVNVLVHMLRAYTFEVWVKNSVNELLLREQ